MTNIVERKSREKELPCCTDSFEIVFFVSPRDIISVDTGLDFSFTRLVFQLDAIRNFTGFANSNFVLLNLYNSILPLSTFVEISSHSPFGTQLLSLCSVFAGEVITECLSSFHKNYETLPSLGKNSNLYLHDFCL